MGTFFLVSSTLIGDGEYTQKSEKSKNMGKHTYFLEAYAPGIPPEKWF